MNMKAQKKIANLPEYYSRSTPFTQLYVPQPIIEPVRIKIWWYQSIWDWLVKLTTPKVKHVGAPAISIKTEATPAGKKPEIKLELDKPEKKKNSEKMERPAPWPEPPPERKKK